MTKVQEIQRKIQQLSPNQVAELDTVLKELTRNKHTGRKFLTQSWGGGLKGFRKKYNALELQKKSLEWRGD